MAVVLKIDDPRAHELARQLAESRNTGIDQAVIGALESELRREKDEAPLAERLLRIAENMRAKSGGKVGQPLTDEERDEMWTRF